MSEILLFLRHRVHNLAAHTWLVNVVYRSTFVLRLVSTATDGRNIAMPDVE